ncbi:MAG: acyloxyacyl hydrolase [Lautropia sp.]
MSIQSAGGEGTDSLSLGLQWAPGPVWRPAPGLLLEGQLEFAMGRWRARGADGVRSWAWVSQFSLVPVLRLRGVDTTGPYAEIGIGPSYLTPVYRSRDKRFSSRFQFRDHLAVGWTWGAGARHDLSVRIEHFSNGGLDEPNPGINLVGVRYTWRF